MRLRRPVGRVGGDGMSEVITPQITETLRRLHVPAFVANFAVQAGLATNDGWPYDRYLLNLCRLELDEREQRKRERLLRASRLPREKTLSAFERSRLKKSV